jgi:preprotein translocase subunit YajC
MAIEILFNTTSRLFSNCTIILLFIISFSYIIRRHDQLTKEFETLHHLKNIFDDDCLDKNDSIFEAISEDSVLQSITGQVISDIQSICNKNGHLNFFITYFPNIYLPKSGWIIYFIISIAIVTASGLLCQINEVFHQSHLIEIYSNLVTLDKNAVQSLPLPSILSIIPNILPGMISIIILIAFHYWQKSLYDQLYAKIHRFTITSLLPFFSMDSSEKSLIEISTILKGVAADMDQNFRTLANKINHNQNQYAQLADNLFETVETNNNHQKTMQKCYQQIHINLKDFQTITRQLTDTYTNEKQEFRDIVKQINSDKEMLDALYKRLDKFFYDLTTNFKDTITQTAGIIRSASKLQDQEIKKVQNEFKQIKLKQDKTN